MPKLPIKNKKVVFIAVGSLLIVFVLALVIIKMIPSTGEDTAAPLSVDEVRVRASEYAEKGDVSKGIEIYDQQIKEQNDKDAKTKLLIDKAHFATNYGKYDEAIAAGNQAAEGGSDLSAALVLAKTYEAKGDKEQAIKYYQMLADEAVEGGEASGRDGNRWQLKVEELRS